MKKIGRLAAMLVTYLVLQVYAVVAVIQGLFFFRGEKTPFSHAYVNGVMRLLFNTKVSLLNPAMKQTIQSESRCVLLSNHRSMADFVVCHYTTSPDRISYIGRLSVFFALPVAFTLFYLLERNFVLFNRAKKNRIHMRKKLFEKMQSLLSRDLFVLVFPEGHRNTKQKTLPLKRGVINWAYDHGYTCALVLHVGNERMFDEKKMTMRRGVEILCLHKGLYRPSEYETRQDFFTAIEKDFQQGYLELETNHYLKGAQNEKN